MEAPAFRLPAGECGERVVTRVIPKALTNRGEICFGLLGESSACAFEVVKRNECGTISPIREPDAASV